MHTNVSRVREFSLNQLGVSATVVYFDFKEVKGDVTIQEGMGYINKRGYITLITEDKQNREDIITFGKLLPSVFPKGHLKVDAALEVGTHNLTMLKLFPVSSAHDDIVRQFDKKMQKAWLEVDQSIQDAYNGWHDWATEQMAIGGMHLRKDEEPTMMELWELPRDPHNPIQN